MAESAVREALEPSARRCIMPFADYSGEEERGAYARGCATALFAAGGLAGERGKERGGGGGGGGGQRRDRRRGFQEGGRARGCVAQRLLDGRDPPPQRRHVHGRRPGSAGRALGISGHSRTWRGRA